MGISGTISATNATGTVVTKAFTIPAGSSSSTVTMADATAEAVSFSAGSYSIVPMGAVYSCWNSGTGSASCSHSYSDAGFFFTSALDGVEASIPAQVAGTSSGTYYLRAVKTNPTTKACEAALEGANSVEFAYQCNNPSTCSGSNLMSLNGGAATTITGNPNTAVSSYTSVSMTFDANGNAPFVFNFSDVGQVTLAAKMPLNAATLTGASNAFVTKPGGFTVTGIQQTAAPQLLNPVAISATSDKFVKAGESFTATVTATTSGGAATPNFGRETTAEGVLLTSSLVQPAGGGTGSLGNGTIAGASFSGGVATVTDLSWSEVGIMSLTPSIADGDYLGAGNVTGSSSVNVGRFYPDHFDTAVTQACSTGGFTYSGQPMTATITAKNGAGTTVTNYDTASFAKDVTLSDANAVAGSLSAADVVNTAFASGLASAMPVFTFTSVQTAPAIIKIRATDTDLVSSAATEGTASIRSGRVRLENAYGSERLGLPVSLQLQYWNGSWQPNTLDTCTVVTKDNFAFTFPAGTTQKPNQLAAAACGTAALTVTGVAPGYTLNLSAPGSANAGWADVTLVLGAAGAGTKCTVVGAAGAAAASVTAPWLQFNWKGTGLADPSARATFGVYKSRLLYRRENY
jgi:MSHA biogenesis protein MshQ